MQARVNKYIETSIKDVDRVLHCRMLTQENSHPLFTACVELVTSYSKECPQLGDLRTILKEVGLVLNTSGSEQTMCSHADPISSCFPGLLVYFFFYWQQQLDDWIFLSWKYLNQTLFSLLTQYVYLACGIWSYLFHIIFISTTITITTPIPLLLLLLLLVVICQMKVKLFCFVSEISRDGHN